MPVPEQGAGQGQTAAAPSIPFPPDLQSHQGNMCICIHKRVHFYRNVKQTESRAKIIHFISQHTNEDLIYSGPFMHFAFNKHPYVK